MTTQNEDELFWIECERIIGRKTINNMGNMSDNARHYFSSQTLVRLSGESSSVDLDEGTVR